jgi:hypothetical protein
MTFAMFTDPVLWVFLVLRVLIVPLRENVLADGYHVQSLADKSLPRRIWESEEMDVMLKTLFEFPVFLWITRYITDFLTQATFLTKVFTIPTGLVPVLTDVQVTTYAAVMGVLVTARWALPWYKTIRHMNLTRRASQIRTVGFVASVMFGIGYGVMAYVVVQTDETVLREVLGQQLTIATVLLRQFQVGAGQQVVQLATEFLWPIFLNNGTLALAGFVIGVVGGVLVVGGLLSVVLTFSAMMLPWGVFTGLFIRRNIAAGDYIFGPPASFFSGFGLIPVAHAFHEFLFVGAAGMAGYFVGLGLVTGEPRVSWDGVVVLFVAEVGVLFAAFSEVFVTPPVKDFLLGGVLVPETLTNLSLKAGSTVGLVSVGIWTLLVFVPMTAGLVRLSVNFTEANAT